MANSSSNNRPAKSMAELMASYKSSFKTFKKGDLVKGVITKLTKNEILVNIDAKSQAVVLEKEKSLMQLLLKTLKEGDTVEVSILNPESETGNPVVSLRRFLSNLAWNEVEKAKKEDLQIQVSITDITKGGLVVATNNGLHGFLPNSHTGGAQQLLVGKKINARVIEINRTDNKIVFSQKNTLSASDFNDAIKDLKVGDVKNVKILNIVPFGIFTTITVDKKEDTGKELTLDALIHISEVSWEKVEDISVRFTPGQELKAKIIGFDKNTRRVDLSIKQLTDDPFAAILKNYPIDKKVSAEIVRIDENGLHLVLEEGIEGLIRKDKLPPASSYKEGQTITATVSEIDKRRRKIYLVPVLLEKPLMYR